MAAACEWDYREPTQTDFARLKDLRHLFPNFPTMIYDLEFYFGIALLLFQMPFWM